MIHHARMTVPAHVLHSASFLAGISFRSPRKLLIFIILKNISGSKYPKKSLFDLENRSTGPAGNVLNHLTANEWIINAGYFDPVNSIANIQVCLAVPDSVKPEYTIHQMIFGRRKPPPLLNCSAFT